MALVTKPNNYDIDSGLIKIYMRFYYQRVQGYFLTIS